MEAVTSEEQFFTNLLSDYQTEVRLLKEGGKLIRKWDNVFRHCRIQLAAAQVLTEVLGMETQERQTICQVAICHDWDKRLSLKPENFTPQEKKHAKKLIGEVQLNPQLMFATSTEFVEFALIQQKATFSQEIQFYLDNICKGDEITSFDERIDEVEARRQDLNEDEEITECLDGRRYWHAVRELCRGVEERIFYILKERGHNFNTARDITIFIRREVEKRIARFV